MTFIRRLPTDFQTKIKCDNCNGYGRFLTPLNKWNFDPSAQCRETECPECGGSGEIELFDEIED